MASVSNCGNTGKPEILVLGIGNTLLSDEGIGVHALRQLEAEFSSRDDLHFIDGGTLGFILSGPIASTRHLIVIDAAQLDASPGTVRVFVDADMDRFVGYGRSSAHEIGLTDLMHVAHLTGNLPERRALIGIQPAHIGLGERPTPAVADALPNICDAVRHLIGEWQS